MDKRQNPLKSIAENGSSLLQCNWIVCTTPELVCGGGNKVSKHPVCIRYSYIQCYVDEVHSALYHMFFYLWPLQSLLLDDYNWMFNVYVYIIRTLGIILRQCQLVDM